MCNNAQIPQDILDCECCSLQDYFGAHEQKDGFVFRIWAPKAIKVMLTGDFNDWRDDYPLKKIHEIGIWEISVPFSEIYEGSRYKYRIYGQGQVTYISDPFATEHAAQSDNSSVLRARNEFHWKDSGWMSYRKAFHKNPAARPINIYEAHLGTWKRHGRSLALNYRDYARELAPYLKQMGYTHIFLTPITEYANDAALGYSPNAFFAPTSRYGQPDDFKAFVDKMHEAGIGVMLNMPIAAFPTEQFGLLKLDGALHSEEHSNKSRGERRSFDLSRKEAQCFLISSVSYWISEYHADAVFFSGVNSMLMHQAYGKGDLLESDEAYFLRRLTRYVKKNYPDVLTVWDSRETLKSDIDLVINKEWSSRMLEYAAVDLDYRGMRSSLLTEMINKDGRIISTLSREDVSRQGKTLVSASSGDYWQKFASARALMGLMMTMRGKKLMFMGGEIAPFREWSYDRELEWFLLDFESHEKFQRYLAELNNFYLMHSSLWQKDLSEESLYFVNGYSFSQGVIIFRRCSKKEELTVVVNLTPNAYESFRLGAHAEGEFIEIFNSDSTKYFGGGMQNEYPIKTDAQPCHGYKQSLVMRVPPLSITVLDFKGKNKNKAK